MPPKHGTIFVYSASPQLQIVCNPVFLRTESQGKSCTRGLACACGIKQIQQAYRLINDTKPLSMIHGHRLLTSSSRSGPRALQKTTLHQSRQFSFKHIDASVICTLLQSQCQGIWWIHAQIPHHGMSACPNADSA